MLCIFRPLFTVWLRYPATGLPACCLLVAAAVGQVPGADCAGIEVPEDRLACYDAAYSGGPQTAADAVVEMSPENNFGLPKAEEAVSIRSPVIRLDKGPTGRYTFYLANGQVWQQIETKRLKVRDGESVVEIKHGALGSYRLFVAGTDHWTRVKRTQ